MLMKMISVFIAWALILLVGYGGFVVYNEYLDDSNLKEEVYSHFEDVAKLKAGRVGFFLDERKDDLVFLRESVEVREFFKYEVLTNRIENKLNFFYKTNEYLDLVLISRDGVVLWSAKDKKKIGQDLTDNKYLETKFGAVYDKVKNDFGVGIYNPGYYETGEKLSVFVTSPILEDSLNIKGKKDIVGIIALRIDNLQIEERVKGENGINIYLVNRDGVVITPLDGVEKVDGEMYKDCFKNYRNYYFERQGQFIEKVKTSGSYVGNFGESIFGAHWYILETGWCVMVEKNKVKFYNEIRRSLGFWIIVIGLVGLGLIFYGSHKK